MKRFILSFIAVVIPLIIFSQNLPQVQLKTLDRKNVESNEVIKNDSGPILLCFWATWCKPCIKELDTYNNLYPDWQEETNVKIILISTDNARSMYRVAPFVNGKGWDFDVYLDANSDLKRAMNVVNVPHTFLLNKEGEIVWQHTSYMSGDEEEVLKEIKKLNTTD